MKHTGHSANKISNQAILLSSPHITRWKQVSKTYELQTLLADAWIQPNVILTIIRIYLQRQSPLPLTELFVIQSPFPILFKSGCSFTTINRSGQSRTSILNIWVTFTSQLKISWKAMNQEPCPGYLQWFHPTIQALQIKHSTRYKTIDRGVFCKNRFVAGLISREHQCSVCVDSQTSWYQFPR